MITDDQHDELIFDFLEGNLSPEEEEGFQILRDESEVFSRQIKLWENAYLHDPLPSIKNLEDKLLIRKEHGTSAIFKRLSFLLFILVMHDSVQIYERVPADRQTNIVNVPNFTTSEDSPQAGSECEVKSVQAETSTQREVTPIVDSRSAEPTLAGAVKVRLNPLLEWRQPVLEKLTIESVSTTTPVSEVVRKKLSRRENRLLRKIRWQNDGTRKANEFQKGKIPYVVPLNDNNF
jgi:hypothetical protein